MLVFHLPEHVIRATSEMYVEIYERLTGGEF